MYNNKIKTILINSIFVIMFAVLIWQSIKLISDLKIRNSLDTLESIVVNVNGNVKYPGRYQVPVGTTNFEILKVVGINPTSNITPFNLTAQVESDDNITVGTLKTPISVRPNVRLEFFFGELTIISSEGRNRLPQEKMSIDQGDRILTEDKSQAELSLNVYSRVDMDKFSEIIFDKIDIDDEGKDVIEIFQKNGICWYKMVYAKKAEEFKIFTPLVYISVTGKGADFTTEVKYTENIINVYDGLLLVERPDGGDAINLISGQCVTIYSDGRPFQVTEISPAISLTDRFRELTKTKTEIVMKHMPFNFLFYGPPNVFYLFSIQYDKSTAHVVYLPSQTSVQFFVKGFSTLQEAFLYGGGVFTSTLVERIMNMRIPKHIIFEKSDIIRTVSSIGGIKVYIDDKASSALNLQSGMQKIKGQNIINFLKPSLSGYKDSEQRQITVLKALFNQVLSKNIIITALLADQILANIESNMTATETMEHYKNFISRKNWSFKNYSLPVKKERIKNKTIYEPQLEKCKTLLLE